MKRISIYLLLLVISLKGFSQGEWVSASIGNALAPNTTSLYIQSTTEFDASKCDNIVFTVRVPVSAGPNVTVTESYKSPSIQHLTFAIQKLNVNDAIYNYYIINGTGTVQATTGTIYGINTPIRLLDLTFAGGITNGTVQLVNIENDIPGNMFIRPQFYMQLNVGDITNYSNMFFRTGATALLVNNQAITGDDFVGTVTDVALPIKFLSFDAIKKDNNAELSWNVQNESALTESYEIERSLNGIDYNKIATVAAKNNGSTTNSYSSIDQNLKSLGTSGRIYYKIKQTDRDGQFILSEVRSVSLDGKNFGVSVYPNPVVTTSSVNINLDVATKLNIILVDATGKEIQNAVLNGLKGANFYTLNMNKLASGTYVLKVVAGNEYVSLPVVKK